MPTGGEEVDATDADEEMEGGGFGGHDAPRKSAPDALKNDGVT